MGRRTTRLSSFRWQWWRRTMRRWVPRRRRRRWKGGWRAFWDWPPRRWYLASAVFFVSRRESSAVVLQWATRTDEASLLHQNDGTCVVQSGACGPPIRSRSMMNDSALFGFDRPYATCFVFQVENGVDKPGAFCWSRSYRNKDGNYKPCKPKGYGSDGWTELEQCDSEDDDSDDKSVVTNNCCGTPCTEFEKT